MWFILKSALTYSMAVKKLNASLVPVMPQLKILTLKNSQPGYGKLQTLNSEYRFSLSTFSDDVTLKTSSKNTKELF